MNVLSLFSGIGGFDLVLEQNNHTIVAQSEIDKHCCEVLHLHFPNVPNLGDVRNIDGRKFQGIDLICGGFPCQDLSCAGKQVGLGGDRSKLWYEFYRIIEEARPKTFLIENVPGLLSSNRGRDLSTILGSLAQLGYSLAYRVLDSQYFGVPQRRRRVFIVGDFRAERPGEILFESEGSGGYTPSRESKGKTVAALTANGLGGGGPDDNLAQAGHLQPARTVGTLTSRKLAGGFPGTDDAINGYVVPYRKKHRPNATDNSETWEEATHTNTLDAGSNVTRTSHVIAFHTTQDPISGPISHALSIGNSNGNATVGILDEWGVRKLMPVECERLMGFPDGWTAIAGHPDTTRYKMLGNSVAVPVVDWIIKRMGNV